MALEKGMDLISVSLKRQLETKYQTREDKGNEELSLDSRLISSVRRILESKVEFEQAPGYSSMVQNNLKGKYKVLAPKKIATNSEKVPMDLKTEKFDVFCKRNESEMGVSCEKKYVDTSPCPPVPSMSLYSEDAVKLGWEGNEPVGAGMINLGNTCYLNSTLQALFHVPSFCNWLTSETNHNGTGKCDQAFISGDMCTICAMAATLRVARSHTGSVIKPALIYGRLRSICKHLSHGHQEDAHEFLRFLIESMERTFLLRYKGKKLDNLSKETTPLHRVFGGYLRNEVTCHSCGKVSTTFQLFQDLFLDIRQSTTLLESMQAFFSRERLEGDESRNDCYKCEKCKRKGYCTKRVYVQVPPKVLCIQLKRFTAMGKKIMKYISYPLKLDLSPFVHIKMNQNGEIFSPSKNIRHPVPYKLVSIVSHYGSAMNCGHYTALGRSAKGSYYVFDDSQVRPASLNSALGASAYILMYEMEPGWNIKMESKVNHNMEKINNCSLKSTNQFVKPLGSNNFQNPGEVTFLKSEHLYSSPSKVKSPSKSENTKLPNFTTVTKDLNSTSVSNVNSCSLKPSLQNQLNVISLSKTPEDHTRLNLNGWLKKETNVATIKCTPTTDIAQNELKNNHISLLPSNLSKHSPSVVQKQGFLPKSLNLKSPSGAQVSTLKAKSHEQIQLKPSKSSKTESTSSCSQESLSVKRKSLQVSSNAPSSSIANQKECDKNSLSRNLQLLKGNNMSVPCSKDSKQLNLEFKKQLTIPNFLNFKKNQCMDGGDNTKTVSNSKIRTIKEWLEDKNSLTGLHSVNEVKQSHREVSAKKYTDKQIVVSTVKGWKVTEHDLSNNSKNPSKKLSVGVKRKRDTKEEMVGNKRKRIDKSINPEVWRRFLQEKLSFSNNKKKSNANIGEEKCEEKVEVSDTNSFLNSTKQNLLFKRI